MRQVFGMFIIKKNVTVRSVKLLPPGEQVVRGRKRKVPSFEGARLVQLMSPGTQQTVVGVQVAPANIDCARQLECCESHGQRSINVVAQLSCHV